MPATLSVVGGPIYARRKSGESWGGQSLWMPRVAASYLLGERTVLKGGYGLYYDTLTAADYDASAGRLQRHDDSTISDDLGRTFKWATPATGAANFDPFPVRADGTRFDPAVGDTLGVNTLLGGTLRPRTACASTRASSAGGCRCSGSSLETQRRSGLQRHVQRPAADRASARTTCRSSTGTRATTRNTAAKTFLNAKVTNPYFIDNFESLRTTDPVLYQRLASNPTFSSARFPVTACCGRSAQMTNLTYANLPLGESRRTRSKCR